MNATFVWTARDLVNATFWLFFFIVGLIFWVAIKLPQWRRRK